MIGGRLPRKCFFKSTVRTSEACQRIYCCVWRYFFFTSLVVFWKSPYILVCDESLHPYDFMRASCCIRLCCKNDQYGAVPSRLLSHVSEDVFRHGLRNVVRMLAMSGLSVCNCPSRRVEVSCGAAQPLFHLQIIVLCLFLSLFYEKRHQWHWPEKLNSAATWLWHFLDLSPFRIRARDYVEFSACLKAARVSDEDSSTTPPDSFISTSCQWRPSMTLDTLHFSGLLSKFETHQFLLAHLKLCSTIILVKKRDWFTFKSKITIFLIMMCSNPPSTITRGGEIWKYYMQQSKDPILWVSPGT